MFDRVEGMLCPIVTSTIVQCCPDTVWCKRRAMQETGMGVERDAEKFEHNKMVGWLNGFMAGLGVNILISQFPILHLFTFYFCLLATTIGVVYICFPLMDKNISNQIKKLVADNRLEEALDRLINYEQDKGRERYNTLILLKGKLEMLEEQELADLLEFDDLEREKRKIAHAVLKMTDDDGRPTFEPSPTKEVEIRKTVTVPEKTSGVYGKYLILLVIVAGIVMGIFFMMSRFPSGNDNQVQNEKQETRDVPPPNNSSGQLRLLDFPNIDRPFNFGDIQYHIKDVKVEKYSDTEIKLTLKIDLTCKSNLGMCYREEVRIVVDDNPIAPKERKAWEGYLEHNASTKEELVFVFPTGEKYKVLLEKNSSTWERAFKILQ